MKQGFFGSTMASQGTASGQGLKDRRIPSGRIKRELRSHLDESGSRSV